MIEKFQPLGSVGSWEFRGFMVCIFIPLVLGSSSLGVGFLNEYMYPQDHKHETTED